MAGYLLCELDAIAGREFGARHSPGRVQGRIREYAHTPDTDRNNEHPFVDVAEEAEKQQRGARKSWD